MRRTGGRVSVLRFQEAAAVTVAILSLSGTGAAAAPPVFEAPRRISGGSFRVTAYSAPALADFNGDGLLDLALGGVGQAGVYFNRGTAQAPQFDQLDAPFGLATHGSVQAVDFNADGLKDLMVRDMDFLNTGTRTQPQFDMDGEKGQHIVRLTCGQLPQGYTCHYRAALVDLNGDGRRDLVLAVFKTKPMEESYSGRYVVAFDEGRGAQGQFGAPRWLSILTVKEGHEVEFTDHGPYIVFADLDGSGRPQPLIGSYGGGVYRLLKKGDLAWSLPDRPLVDRGGCGMYTAPAVADLNGDGLPDLVIGDMEGGVRVAWNRGTREAAAFGKSEVLPGGDFRVGAQPMFDVADFDGDGLKDVLVGERTAGYPFGAVKVFRNVGAARTPRFQFDGSVSAEGPVLITEEVWCYAAPQMADLDSDGAEDLLLVAGMDAASPARCTVYFNRGGLPPRLYRSAPLAGSPFCLTDRAGAAIEVARGFNARWVDVDGDGLADLVVGGAEVAFRKNIGRATHPVLMERRPLLSVGGAKLSGTVAVGDLNGDGLPDLVLGDPNAGSLRFCENVGPADAARFAEPLVVQAAGKPLQFGQGVFPVISDFDGDGTNDLLLALQQSTEFLWLKPAR